MFVQDGYEAVTMRALAKRIEYSPTAIYLHFKDKEALLEEICNQDMAALDGYVQQEVEGLVDFHRLYGTARAFVRFALEHQPQYRLLFMTPKPPHAPSAMTGAENEAYTALKAGWSELIDAGALRSELNDADVLAQVFFLGLHGIVAGTIAMGSCPIPEWRDPQTQATTFVDCLIKGIVK
jgi:AcrR family transcriptional regulator